MWGKFGLHATRARSKLLEQTHVGHKPRSTRRTLTNVQLAAVERTGLIVRMAVSLEIFPTDDRKASNDRVDA